MASTTGDFRATDLGGMVDELFIVYRKNFWRFIAVAAVAEAPLIVLGAIAAWLISGGLLEVLEGGSHLAARSLLVVLLVVGSVLAGLLMSAAVAYLVAAHYLGNRIGTGQTYRLVLPRLWSLLGAGFLAVLAVTAMAVTVIGIPAAIYFGLTWAFIVQAVVIEGSGARKSLSRSSSLVKKRWWRVLGILIVMGLIGSILSSVAGGVVVFIVTSIGDAAGASGFLTTQVASVAASLVGVVFLPVTLIGVTLLYFDLRIRKEGYSLQDMAQELGTDQRPG